MDRLRAMELFLSISRTGSFTETSRLFGVSATSVSRMITEFESDLGVTLLQRSTRQVVLTEAGQEYARQLDGILWSINEARNSITAINSSPKGVLRIHSRTMFGLGVLTPLIAAFRVEYPDILVELLFTEAKADLRKQQVDIDFRISPPVEAGVRRRMLFMSDRYLVASPAYVARMPRLEQPDDILKHDCLVYWLPGDQHVWRFMCDQKTREIVIKPRHLTNNGMVLLKMARLGEGIALLDDYTVAPDIEEGHLVRLLPNYRVTNTTFEEGIYATIPDTPVIPAKVRLFMDFIASHVSGKDARFKLHKYLQGVKKSSVAG
ncbi:MAG: LysR family transcriptional regulator [Alcaligenaceae bacterium]|nr:LysR family transcriptional regulator [Alcaligenaceae bacterium]